MICPCWQPITRSIDFCLIVLVTCVCIQNNTYMYASRFHIGFVLYHDFFFFNHDRLSLRSLNQIVELFFAIKPEGKDDHFVFY